MNFRQYLFDYFHNHAIMALLLIISLTSVSACGCTANTGGTNANSDSSVAAGNADMASGYFCRTFSSPYTGYVSSDNAMLFDSSDPSVSVNTVSADTPVVVIGWIGSGDPTGNYVCNWYMIEPSHETSDFSEKYAILCSSIAFSDPDTDALSGNMTDTGDIGNTDNTENSDSISDNSVSSDSVSSDSVSSNSVSSDSVSGDLAGSLSEGISINGVVLYPEVKTMYTTRSANIRAMANKNSNLLGTIPVNSELLIDGETSEGWAHISGGYNGSDAYILSSLLSVSKITPKPAAATAATKPAAATPAAATSATVTTAPAAAATPAAPATPAAAH